MEGNCQPRVEIVRPKTSFLEAWLMRNESLMTHNSVTPGRWQKADVSSITRLSSPKSGRGWESFLKELSNPILWTLSQKIKFAILVQQWFQKSIFMVGPFISICTRAAKRKRAKKGRFGCAISLFSKTDPYKESYHWLKKVSKNGESNSHFYICRRNRLVLTRW